MQQLLVNLLLVLFLFEICRYVVIDSKVEHFGLPYDHGHVIILLWSWNSKAFIADEIIYDEDLDAIAKHMAIDTP